MLQSTLTEEAQLAYESLIEAPITDITSQTQFANQRHRSTQGSLPDNPLRMLRSGNLPMIKPRIRTNTTVLSEGSTQSIKFRTSLKPERPKSDRISTSDVCLKTDLPNGDDIDYLPENSIPHTIQSIDTTDCGINHSPEPTVNDPQTSNLDDNPIPLPPRDRNKSLLSSKPRHTRKHPLIIPASSIQRTLEKVNVITPEDIIQNPLDAHFMDNNITVIADSKVEPYYINQRYMGSDTSIETPERDFDTESLHFEAQIDLDLAALDAIPCEDLDTQISLSSNIVNDTEQKSTRSAFRQIHSNVDLRDREERRQTCTDEEVMLRHSADHVSCEDLLEFADVKPSSRARGKDSDEVRIMSKVLGPEVSKEQCLNALDYSNWDVHKAIKLAKLQKVIRDTSGEPTLDLPTCNGALETSQWDVGRAARWVVAARQDGDITQV